VSLVRVHVHHAVDVDGRAIGTVDLCRDRDTVSVRRSAIAQEAVRASGGADAGNIVSGPQRRNDLTCRWVSRNGDGVVELRNGERPVDHAGDAAADCPRQGWGRWRRGRGGRAGGHAEGHDLMREPRRHVKHGAGSVGSDAGSHG
jgi:hypothetical protein